MERGFEFAPYTVTAMLLIVGIIHLLPLTGVLGGERLATLYGLPFDEPNLQILMRHRALLFGLLGAFLVFAAFNAQYQAVALVAGFASVVSFLWLALSADSYNAAIRRVVIADWIALGAIALAAIAYAVSRARA